MLEYFFGWAAGPLALKKRKAALDDPFSLFLWLLALALALLALARSSALTLASALASVRPLSLRRGVGVIDDRT